MIAKKVISVVMISMQSDLHYIAVGWYNGSNNVH